MNDHKVTFNLPGQEPRTIYPTPKLQKSVRILESLMKKYVIASNRYHQENDDLIKVKEELDKIIIYNEAESLKSASDPLEMSFMKRKQQLLELRVKHLCETVDHFSQLRDGIKNDTYDICKNTSDHMLFWHIYDYRMTDLDNNKLSNLGIYIALPDTILNMVLEQHIDLTN